MPQRKRASFGASLLFHIFAGNLQHVLIHVLLHHLVVISCCALVHLFDVFVAIQRFLIPLMSDKIYAYIGAVVGNTLQIGQHFQEHQSRVDRFSGV